MRPREFIGLMAETAAWPLAARLQQRALSAISNDRRVHRQEYAHEILR
ncbi:MULTISPECIES: hypothetical protein [unclassified Bradyrhizobium]|nr:MULTISPECIES: hypothetical protein [unclassified Bradyrhizobium]MCP3464698.1 hypothetical protein [Bradyrhizobium sp. CCGUVB23]